MIVSHITHCAAFALLLLGTALSARASVPPPPPEYITDMAKVVAPTLTATSFAAYAKLLGNDLTVTIDGKPVATSKAAWFATERHRLGKVDRTMVAHVEGYDTLLVIDRYDDRSDLPDDPKILFDPRYVIRAVQYQVGDNHLIHTIRIVQSPGLLLTKDPQ